MSAKQPTLTERMTHVETMVEDYLQNGLTARVDRLERKVDTMTQRQMAILVATVGGLLGVVGVLIAVLVQ